MLALSGRVAPRHLGTDRRLTKRPQNACWQRRDSKRPRPTRPPPPARPTADCMNMVTLQRYQPPQGQGGAKGPPSHGGTGYLASFHNCTHRWFERWDNAGQRPTGVTVKQLRPLSPARSPLPDMTPQRPFAFGGVVQPNGVLGNVLVAAVGLFAPDGAPKGHHALSISLLRLRRVVTELLQEEPATRGGRLALYERSGLVVAATHGTQDRDLLTRVKDADLEAAAALLQVQHQHRGLDRGTVGPPCDFLGAEGGGLGGSGLMIVFWGNDRLAYRTWWYITTLHHRLLFHDELVSLHPGLVYPDRGGALPLPVCHTIQQNDTRTPPCIIDDKRDGVSPLHYK